MQHDYLKNLVKRYLDKKSTNEELEIFIHLMKQGKLDQYIREAMDADIAVQQEKKEERTGKVIPLRWPIAAAIALMMAFFGYILFQQRSNSVPRMVKISNTEKSIRKEVLPDGTTVWLNPNASLSYPQKFGKLRKVKMQGEAFFEVTKDHAHPFVITSGRVVTKVWGTSFRIRSVPGENNTQVSVLSGKVSVTVPSANAGAELSKDRRKKEIFLLPQQEVIYKAADHRLIKSPIPETSDVVIWRKSSLSFENTPLKVIAAELAGFYRVKLDIEGNELQENKLTADFTDKNLADILLLICKSMHSTYSKEKDTITLRTTK
ncbi:FecR family protein [Pedobacter hartonius]|uniref:FecR family protein n=1 Tax=Pedobacter hartonius TaxID=425514 RepID=A0A1H4EZY6_9SPHI|nr:FecR domain-containing protein [Pedobacter hartonius]SEA89862.1 FecR family protein [Pedobacter hartonius]